MGKFCYYVCEGCNSPVDQLSGACPNGCCAKKIQFCQSLEIGPESETKDLKNPLPIMGEGNSLLEADGVFAESR